MIAESYVGYKHRKAIGIERNVVVRAYKYHPGPRQSDTVSHKNINLAAQNTELAITIHTSSLLSPIRSGEGSELGILLSAKQTLMSIVEVSRESRL